LVPVGSSCSNGHHGEVVDVLLSVDRLKQLLLDDDRVLLPADRPNRPSLDRYQRPDCRRWASPGARATTWLHAHVNGREGFGRQDRRVPQVTNTYTPPAIRPDLSIYDVPTHTTTEF
jgi:hypothetical protein